MRLLLLQSQAIQEPLQLPTTDGAGPIGGMFWPAKASSLQSAIVEPEAVMIPVEDLELVSSSIAEDEEAVAEEVGFEDLADECSQAVDRLSQIGAATGEVDVGALGGA